MNLQPVPIEDIPLGVRLPWRLYDRNGYIVFARGEMVASREQLESLIPAGLLRDMDARPETHEKGELAEFGEIAPAGAFPPAGIKPQIGERIQLRLPDQSSQNYYSATLIGYIRNLSILVTRPMAGTPPFVPEEGSQVEVRMVTGNNIYAFRSAIQRLCISPSNYMHLDYPAEVRVQKLRKSPWVRVNLGATATDAQGAHEAARLVNLSPDGAQLHAPPTLGKPGAAMRLSFHAAMDELKTTLNLEATILHVHAPLAGRNAETNVLEYGIAFRNLTAEDELWLQGLVYRYIAEGHMA
ncbi:MAG TPA: flagellar brake protein [Gallionella sp.]|nr:flagellar brake protein [Gallionella sp.]